MKAFASKIFNFGIKLFKKLASQFGFQVAITASRRDSVRKSKFPSDVPDSKLPNSSVVNVPGYDTFVKNLRLRNSDIVVAGIRRKRENQRECVNLNVGAGSYEITGFKSLDIMSTRYYHSTRRFSDSRIPYDMRTDDLPFSDGIVSNIYCSHVIEHVENQYVARFLDESHRVLEGGGVLRIACPDGEFLFQVSQFENDYWMWRYPSVFAPPRYSTNWKEIEPYDFLIREISSPRFRFDTSGKSDLRTSPQEVKGLSYQELKEQVRNGVAFDGGYPGNHINVWDFDEIRSMAIRAGFQHVVRSKKGGSVAAAMQGEMFDRTCPQMSLYVDLVK